MNFQSELRRTSDCELNPYEWLGRVLTHFAKAEQAIGTLCRCVDLPTDKGSLSSLVELRKRLIKAEDRRCKALVNRIDRWNSHRPLRHLLAHATLHQVIDLNGDPMIVTRHLPRDKDDVTPDRLWSAEEQTELLRQANNDSRSIADQVRNIAADPAIISKLRAA